MAGIAHRAPEAIGLDPDRLEHLRALVRSAIAEGIFPGAVVLVGRAHRVGWLEAFGYAQVVPYRRPMRPNAIFDLASLTKVLGTLPVLLRLVQEGRLDLDTPVGRILDEFSGEGRERITLRHLLAHTSGLPAWRPVYLDVQPGSDRQAVLRVLCRVHLQHAPGSMVVYSDLGFLLAGFLAERITGERIDALVRHFVSSPLGLQETTFCPPAILRDRCVATEMGNRYERSLAGAVGEGFPWREHVLVGEVHDGNAHYALEGIAPHAGLFSTAEEVARIAERWLLADSWLDPALLAEALRDQRRGAAGPPRGLGWLLHHEDAFFAPLGPRAFGHTGFTGTSVAIDPDRRLVVVLLTNRVHPHVNDDRITPFRGVFHEGVRDALRDG